MACNDSLTCIHEPFGDAYYYGPERMAIRYSDDEKARLESGFSGCTFRDVLEQIDAAAAAEPEKRLFIKDMMHYLVPPNKRPASFAPSLVAYLADQTKEQRPGPFLPSPAPSTSSSKQTVGPDTEIGNPTIMPWALLSKFQFAFLIRHPQYSIPSYYRCTIPPLSELTGFTEFLPEEAGYEELCRTIKYFLSTGLVSPEDITLIDADDLLHRPEPVLRAFCERVGLPFTKSMIDWSGATEEEKEQIKEKFAKWKGFHEDAIHSTGLRARPDGKRKEADPDEKRVVAEWKAKYGRDAAIMMRDCVRENVPHYQYLRRFALKVN